jgi:hypothetical protein
MDMLLGVVVVCGSIAYLMVDNRKLLRQSPCSIAGKIVLLARSELCDTRRVIPPGAEWLDHRQQGEQKLFDDWLFTLGVWDDATDWYVIDVEMADKVE